MDINQIKVVILISAETEWIEVKNHFPNGNISNSPFGEWFTIELVQNNSVVFFQSGWGKILAASSTQYVIDKWNPNLIINVGTCGGFKGSIELGTIILVNHTIVYDIVEQMGDQDEAIEFFTSDLDLSWLGENYPIDVKIYKILSADRDIVPSDIPMLKKKFGGIAADWESGAIAYVANANKVKCLILRGVTDLVSVHGGEAYDGRLELFKERAKFIMQTLIQSLPKWISMMNN